MALQLSIVDQSPMRKGGTAADALRETVELAVAADKLGYSRYWVAEHHNSKHFAATCPELMIAQIAARTQNIRVGSGGVLLSNYSALKVAESFRVLEALYPGRIDLGLGRASGGDEKVSAALIYPSRPAGGANYQEQIEDLILFLLDRVPAAHRFAGVHASPTGGDMPPVWLLGSGVESAKLAAKAGLPFSFAHFAATGQRARMDAVEHYLSQFRPSMFSSQPKLNIAVSAFCAETEAEANRLASSLRMMRLQAERNEIEGILSPEEARQIECSSDERALVERAAKSDIVGSPGQVKAGLEAIARQYGTNDLSIITICHAYEDRVRSYELIAEACGLI